MSKVVTPEQAKEYLNRFMEGLTRRNPGETEFHQAVYEVVQSIFPYIADSVAITHICHGAFSHPIRFYVTNAYFW